MRKQIVAGNWKMNKTAEEANVLASEIINMAKDELPSAVELVLAPPALYLQQISKLIGHSKNIHLSAQNCHEKDSGAFTGEIAAPMLKSMAVTHVILGHSERREYFKESNQQLKDKTDNALKNGLTPIFCCGESLETRESGKHFEFVCEQLSASLFHLSADDFQKIIIAYEPIWAIGTGKTASSEQAQEMHQKIRQHIVTKYGQAVADNISILYGGSCKPDNAKEIFAGADVDGGLIGGASLKSRDFIDIAKSFK